RPGKRRRVAELGGDLEAAGAEILGRAVENHADGLHCRAAFGTRGLEQRVHEIERPADEAGAVSGSECGMERRLQLVRHKRRKALERLVAAGEVDRGACESLLGGAATSNRLQRRQRTCEPRLAVPAEEDEDAGTAERQFVAEPESMPVGGDEAE